MALRKHRRLRRCNPLVGVKYVKRGLPKEAFDKRSFRTKWIGPKSKPKARMIIGCPKGSWDATKQVCRVGTRMHKMYRYAGNPYVEVTGITKAGKPIRSSKFPLDSAGRKKALTFLRTLDRAAFRVTAKNNPLLEIINPPKCSQCGGVLISMGKLGHLIWFRCRACGMEYSRKAGKNPGARWHRTKADKEIVRAERSKSRDRFLLHEGKSRAHIDSLREISRRTGRSLWNPGAPWHEQTAQTYERQAREAAKLGNRTRAYTLKLLAEEHREYAKEHRASKMRGKNPGAAWHKRQAAANYRLSIKRAAAGDDRGDRYYGARGDQESVCRHESEKLGLKNPPVKGIPIARFRSSAFRAQYAKAVRQYVRQHGCMPTTASRKLLLLGSSKKVTDSTVMVRMGTAPTETYQPDRQSKKGKGQAYQHEYKSRPVKASDASGRMYLTLPGKHRINKDGWIVG